MDKVNYCKICKDYFFDSNHYRSYSHVRLKALKTYCEICDSWVFEIEKHRASRVHKLNEFKLNSQTEKSLETPSLPEQGQRLPEVEKLVESPALCCPAREGASKVQFQKG
tara:strand:+ start:9323 stop:9652 length:330 start_codon:yes stop_codon:yes gene_type:complete